MTHPNSAAASAARDKDAFSPLPASSSSSIGATNGTGSTVAKKKKKTTARGKAGRRRSSTSSTASSAAATTASASAVACAAEVANATSVTSANGAVRRPSTKRKLGRVLDIIERAQDVVSQQRTDIVDFGGSNNNDNDEQLDPHHQDILEPRPIRPGGVSLVSHVPITENNWSGDQNFMDVLETLGNGGGEGPGGFAAAAAAPDRGATVGNNHQYHTTMGSTPSAPTGGRGYIANDLYDMKNHVNFAMTNMRKRQCFDTFAGNFLPKNPTSPSCPAGTGAAPVGASNPALSESCFRMDSFFETATAPVEVHFPDQASSSTSTGTVTNESESSAGNTNCLLEMYQDHSRINGGGGARVTNAFRKYQTDQWQDRFEELVTFYKKHGHCSVPHNYPDNQQLAQWVKRQRYQYKLKHKMGRHSTLTDSREKALKDMGFVWDSHQAAWAERFEALKAFSEKYGHCSVPSHYSDDKALAIWVKCQRRQYKALARGERSPMTADRLKALEALGFDWNPRNL